MDAARKIASQSELRAIAIAGQGFIADPFNRFWHLATCPQILNMTVGQPKWFAPTRDSLDAYLKQRLAQHSTANPLLACKACVGYGNRLSSARGVARSTSQRTPTADPHLRPPFTRRMESGFQVWADECVRNESGPASTAGALRRLIAAEIRALPKPAGRILRAGYAGARSDATDVENLLFNNIDQALRLFRAGGHFGVSFEDLGLKVPPAPDDTSRHSFYSYALERAGSPFATVDEDRLLCRVPDVIVQDGHARLAARVWLAVRQARARENHGPTHDEGDYLLRIVLSGLDVPASFKSVVDGASAAMQRDAPERIREAIARLSILLDVPADELLALATAHYAPLGTRSSSKPTSKHSLFTLDGTDQVRVTPDDDRCIAAEILAVRDGQAPSLKVEVYSAARS